MIIPHFFQSIPDKVSNLFLPNHLLENILILKAAINLISTSLFISSLALLILTISHHKSRKSMKLVKSDSNPMILPRTNQQAK